MFTTVRESINVQDEHKHHTIRTDPDSVSCVPNTLIIFQLDIVAIELVLVKSCT